MTYAPSDLLTVRAWLLARFDINKGLTRPADLDPAEVGISGDAAHKATGGYHCGNDWLDDVGRLKSDYSKRESSRDRPGTNAASALDIGEFDAVLAGRRHTLRSLSVAIVEACRRGDPRTRDVREVIYSPDGSSVKRWDRLGIRSTGGSDHTWHTHISFHRDSEGRRDGDDDFLGLLRALVDGAVTESAPATTTAPQPEEEDETMKLVGLFAKAASGKPNTWVFFGYAPNGNKIWREYTSQNLGTANGTAFGSTTECSHAELAGEKTRFEAE